MQTFGASPSKRSNIERHAEHYSSSIVGMSDEDEGTLGTDAEESVSEHFTGFGIVVAECGRPEHW